MNAKKTVLLSLSMMMAGTMLLYATGGAVKVNAVQANIGHLTPAISLKSLGTEEQKKAVQQALDEMVALGIPGVLAQSLKDGVKWGYAAGKANIHSGRSIQPDFHFRIGSTTKTFTATVVLQLVGEGKLSLDDTVEKWLPGVVQGNGYDGSKITIRQLLNMTSGIASFNEANTQFAKDALENPLKSYKPEQLVKLGLQQKPLFAPGTSWFYSNTNYVLASLIIEKVTGSTYPEQVRNRIIEPLQLKNTYVPEASQHQLPEPYTRGYFAQKPGGDLRDFTEINATAAYASGGMVSTAGDINRFFTELLSGKLLKPEQMKQMFEDTVDSPNGRYGLGIFETKLANGVAVWGHNGAIPGYLTFVGGTLHGKHVISYSLNLLAIDKMKSIKEISQKVLEAEFTHSAK
ncbi:serine hydrolase domain-containing protein [Paenibacillus sp. 481]|uniref:serine hydrolase domain-containing protein n=1 Tax=Paenibacillus sp. 481 TaxID=2835869 RepID=UPI001E5BB7A5|nr:serine hydrolase domain-containing protein [Paenibacillus sp. 481]UHA75546.1 beta-lactamase family protein [Paenibacillus sp. 481]